jgi:hypothetical protein
VPFRRRKPPPEAAPEATAEVTAVAGADPAGPVRHVLLVRDPAAAEAAAAALRAEGFEVTLDTHDGGFTWIVRAARTAPLTAGQVAWVRAVAARNGGEYEGWEPV